MHFSIIIILIIIITNIYNPEIGESFFDINL